MELEKSKQELAAAQAKVEVAEARLQKCEARQLHAMEEAAIALKMESQLRKGYDELIQENEQLKQELADAEAIIKELRQK